MNSSWKNGFPALFKAVLGRFPAPNPSRALGSLVPCVAAVGLIRFARDLDLHYIVCLSKGEMPEWILPIEKDSISFMASKDLYDKFLGFALYVALGNDEQRNGLPFELVPRVNGERWNDYVPYWKPFELNSDYKWHEYFMPSELWGVVNFGQIDEGYAQFSLTMSGRTMKKWGFRIICKKLEDDLKVRVQSCMKTVRAKQIHRKIRKIVK